VRLELCVINKATNVVGELRFWWRSVSASTSLVLAFVSFVVTSLVILGEELVDDTEILLAVPMAGEQVVELQSSRAQGERKILSSVQSQIKIPRRRKERKTKKKKKRRRRRKEESELYIYI
jgi:hypothetical protein